jgi:hypothetical protein
MVNYSFLGRFLDLGETPPSPDVSSSFNHHGFIIVLSCSRQVPVNVEPVSDKSSWGKKGGK